MNPVFVITAIITNKFQIAITTSEVIFLISDFMTKKGPIKRHADNLI
jgi:hypothetical protein